MFITGFSPLDLLIKRKIQHGYFILIVGGSSAGKTALLNRFKEENQLIAHDDIEDKEQFFLIALQIKINQELHVGTLRLNKLPMCCHAEVITSPSRLLSADLVLKVSKTNQGHFISVLENKNYQKRENVCKFNVIFKNGGPYAAN